MSVESKMTAIADRLRALQGSTADLTLDGMDTALSQLQTHTASSFTAVGQRGGTVPQGQLPSALPAAILTIPTVQRHTGSFTTNASGTAVLSCGFQPDLVVISLGVYETDFESLIALPLREQQQTGKKPLSVAMTNDGLLETWVTARSSTGVTLALYLYDWSWEGAAYASRTLNYCAVKYTA